MSRILTSLHGNLVGLDTERRLMAPKGVVLGEHGAQRVLSCPLHVSSFEDFLGDVVPDQINGATGSDGGVVTPTINSQVGGVVRLVTGAGGTFTMAVNGVAMNSALQWKANAGRLSFQARFKTSAITNLCLFVGLTDTLALEMPINSAASADTFTTTATDAVGVMFDTAMATDNWWLTGVKADVDATMQNSGVAPVAAAFETWRIEIDTSGNAIFFRNGNQIGTMLANALTASVALTPVVAAFTRSAAICNIDVDYWDVTSLRV